MRAFETMRYNLLGGTPTHAERLTMIVQRNPLTLVRVALASALIGVLGCSEEPIQQPVSAKQNAPENPPKLSPPPPPKRAVSETQLALPEYYGFYAIADGKTTEIKASPTEAPEFTANVEFLAFDKAVATGLANLPTLHRLSLKPPPANQTDDGSFKGWDDFFQKSQVDAPKQWAEARSGIPGDAIAIELRTKPVKDQPEMIRMVPAKVLEPGLYLLRRITYVWIDRSVYISGRIASARLAFQSDDFQSASFHAGIVLSIEPMNAEAKSLLAESADRFGRRAALEGRVGASTVEQIVRSVIISPSVFTWGNLVDIYGTMTPAFQEFVTQRLALAVADPHIELTMSVGLAPEQVLLLNTDEPVTSGLMGVTDGQLWQMMIEFANATPKRDVDGEPNNK